MTAKKINELNGILADVRAIQTRISKIDVSAQWELDLRNDMNRHVTNLDLVVSDFVISTTDETKGYPCDGCGTVKPLDELEDGSKGVGVFGLTLCANCMKKEVV